MAKILDGVAIAADIRAELKQEIKENPDLQPCLKVFLIGSNSASLSYVKNKIKACEDVGIISILEELSEEVSQKDLISKIHEANSDESIHGILVQLPTPKHINDFSIFEAIDPLKDVDVFNPENVGLLVQGRPRFQPCTPAAVQQILLRSNIPIPGKHIVIINRSNVVGKPLSSMLIQEHEFANATVTVCHDRTPIISLEYICQTADIIVVAVGIPNFLTKRMVHPGATIIDVGITRVGKKLYGDSSEEAREIAGYATPVPGGVGPCTCAMLLKNTVQAALVNKCQKQSQ